jgi:hypothetical protein
MLVAGCIDVKQSYPDRRYYSLEAVRTGAERKGDSKAVLRVRRFSASRMYDGREMVTRTGRTTYDSDYYNVLFIPPAVQIGELARRWLQDSGLFRHVVGPGSSVPETQILEGNLVSLHGDYRSPNNPCAVLEVQFLLVSVTADPVSVLLEKTYRQEIPLDKRDPEVLTQGWDEGLRRILARLEEDLIKGPLGDSGWQMPHPSSIPAPGDGPQSSIDPARTQAR